MNFEQNTKEEEVELNPKSGSSVNISDDEIDNTHDTLAVLRLFINLHYGSWITTAFCVGVFNGVIWGFLFWHLENLGNTSATLKAAYTKLMFPQCRC